MQNKSNAKAPLLLFWGAALCACIAAIPLVYLAIRIGGAGISEIVSILTRLRTWETVGISVGLAVVVVTASLLISYPTALLLTRTQLPLRRFWFTTAALPLAIPSSIRLCIWAILLSFSDSSIIKTTRKDLESNSR